MKKKIFFLTILLLAISSVAFSQVVVEKKEPVSWSANFEVSRIYNYIRPGGVNFFQHNRSVWMYGFKMTDPSHAFNANLYGVSGKNYSEYGAESCHILASS